MQKKECIGCRTHFKDNERLPLEGISIELKNYNFPIKESKHKWNLLKTICSLLNSKGGTIFIGAEDKTGEIKGYNAQRKELDDFRLFVQQLTERIRPALDLSDKQEIIVQYIPILTKDKFSGRHLIKIVVKQGDPHQLYCFSQKIQIQEKQNPHKNEEYEIFHAYKRLNSGNIKQIKGYELIQEATKKGKNPSQIANTFHEDCNPEPPNLQTKITKIAFKNIYYSQSYTKLEKWLSNSLSKQGCKPQFISFDQEYDMLVIDFGNSEDNQLQKSLSFLEKNIGEINSILLNYQFIRKQTFLDCFQFENVIQKMLEKKQDLMQEKDQGEWEDEEQENDDVGEWEDCEDDQSVEEQQSSTKPTKTPVFKKQMESKKKHDKKVEQFGSKTQSKIIPHPYARQPEVDKKKPPGPANFPKNNALTFTHILPQRNKDLGEYLKVISECEVETKIYLNSVEVFFRSQRDLNRYSKLISKQKGMLCQQFGFSQRMDIGKNLSQIQIRNYDNKKYQQMKKYLEDLIKDDLSVCKTIKKGNKYSLGLSLKNSSLTCFWLDSLLKNRQIRQFGIPGAERGQAAKLKYHLLVDAI